MKEVAPVAAAEAATVTVIAIEAVAETFRTAYSVHNHQVLKDMVPWPPGR